MPRPRKARADVPGKSPIATLPDDRMYERRPEIDTDGRDLPAKRRGGHEVDLLARHDDAEFLAMARKRFNTSNEYESSLRKEQVLDQRFYASQQWPDQVIADRTNDRRPILTINRLPQFVKQITNPQRQSRPAIQVNPIGDGADKDTAEVIQGMIRHIERFSHAEVAYDEAYEDAVIMGRGWFRIYTDYIDDGSFDQEIKVQRIPNSLCVYPDPAAVELDYSDMRYCFIVEDIPKDEYKRLYGDASMASLEMFTGMGNQAPDWFPEGRVRVAEYFYLDYEDKVLCLVQNPDSPDGDPLIVPEDYVPEGATILKRRTVKQKVVKWAKINAAEILEEKEWPGQWIPVVPVLGDEIVLDGKREYVGIVRNARDPQRMYNYWVSALTETIALAPRSPVVGAEGQFKGHEQEWKQANTRNLPYLEYVPISLDGKPVAAPQRQQFEPPIAAIVQATKQADNDLKAVIGLFDASLGEKGPDQSGKAILARQKQGETSNVNFIDNLGRALWHAGRIYLDLIPKFYDTARVIHILGGDDQQRVVIINEEWIDRGVKKLYDVRVGRYDVTMSIGPSYQDRRQEAVASMLQLVQAAPNLMPYIADLLVGEMDWPAAEQIAERLKKILPPEVREDDDQTPDPSQLMSQLQALQALVQQQHALLGKQKELLDSKQMEIASKERIALSANETQLAIAAERFGSTAAIAKVESDLAKFSDQMNRLHEWMLQQDSQNHEMAMQAAGSAHDAAESDAQRQADAQQQAAAAQAAPAGQGGGE